MGSGTPPAKKISKIIFSLTFKSKQENKNFKFLTSSPPTEKIPPKQMLKLFFKFKTILTELNT